MKVLFVASELTPIAKIGGLGDVIGSLPKALFNLGIDVQIIIPKYEEIDEKKWGLELIVKGFDTGFSVRGGSAFGGKNEKINVYKTFLPGTKISIYLIENKKYLSQGPIYFEHTAFVGKFEEIKRFSFFSKAVFELLTKSRNDAKIRKEIELEPDIIHCNDWHTGVLVNLLRNNSQLSASSFQLPKIVFTIHNLANQGKWNFNEVSEWFGKNDFRRFDNNFNFMAEGILNSDLVTTVSPTYAKEILTKEYGMGLEVLLKSYKNKLIGIINGIDYDFWPKIIHNHSHKSGFPRFGFVARLTEQKGVNLFLPLISEFVEKYEAEFYVLGQGDKKYEDTLIEISRKYPKKVFIEIGFDEERAHRIYSQTDFLLIPSVFEPCGLSQMIAMRYGTIPIVRSTGGLKDTVKHLKTGFVFKEKNSVALSSVVKLAIDYFYNKSEKFKLMQENCRKQDFSWTESAKKYINIYEKLLK